MTGAETRGQRFYMVRLACGDGARKPESLRAFSERIFRATGQRIHPSELSEIETDKPSKTVSVDHIAAVAAVDPKKRGKLWLGWGEPEQQRVPLASYQIPDSVASALEQAHPAPAAPPKPAERPRAKSAKGKR